MKLWLEIRLLSLLSISSFLIEGFIMRPSSTSSSTRIGPQLFRHGIHRLAISTSGHETLLGTPGCRPLNTKYSSNAGVKVTSEVSSIDDVGAELDNLVSLIDDYKGKIKYGYLIPSTS